MSDYLSSLAARSLRRAPACEPRRPQMFEPRPETSGEPFVEEVREGLSSAETFEGVAARTPLSNVPPVSITSAPNEPETGVLNEPRTETHAPTFVTAPQRREGDEQHTNASPQHTAAPDAPRASATPHPLATTPNTRHEPSRLQAPASQPTQTHASEEAPNASVQTEQSVHPVVTVRESSPHIVARLAESRTASHEPVSSPTITPAKEVSGVPPAPGPTHESERATTSAPFSEEQTQARSLSPSVKSASVSSSIQPSASADEGVGANRQAARGLGVRAEVFDEGGRERTPAVVPREFAETRVERVEAKSSTTVVDTEVIPQPRTSMPSQTSERSTGSSSDTVSDVVLQPLRTGALATQAEREVFVRGREAGLEGVQSGARALTAEAAPTIEVTIGRIEVRALTPPAPPPQPSPRQRQEPPKMSLDDYLRAHSGGRK